MCFDFNFTFVTNFLQTKVLSPLIFSVKSLLYHFQTVSWQHFETFSKAPHVHQVLLWNALLSSNVGQVSCDCFSVPWGRFGGWLVQNKIRCWIKVCVVPSGAAWACVEGEIPGAILHVYWLWEHPAPVSCAQPYQALHPGGEEEQLHYSW